MSCSITCCNMIVLGIESSWLALSLSHHTLVVAPLLPPSTSSKCLPPPSKLTGDMSSRESPTGTYAKSINVSTSCSYLAGTSALPLSMQKLCKQHRQLVSATTLLIERVLLNAFFRIHQQLVSIPNAHLILIQTCEWKKLKLSFGQRLWLR